MICNSKLSDSVQLPADSDPIDCLPCNPGMYLTNSTCKYCPENHRSDGQECIKCDANTAPEYAYMFNNWNVIPDELMNTCVAFSGVYHKLPC